MTLMRLATVLAPALWMAAPQVAAQTQSVMSIALDGSQINLAWDCVPGRSYRLEETGALGKDWLEVETVPKPLVATSNRLFYALDLQPSNRFYRVVELPENNFQLEVTTTTAPQDFICRFLDPGTLHVDWGDGSSEDFNVTITNIRQKHPGHDLRERFQRLRAAERG